MILFLRKIETQIIVMTGSANDRTAQMARRPLLAGLLRTLRWTHGNGVSGSCLLGVWELFAGCRGNSLSVSLLLYTEACFCFCEFHVQLAHVFSLTVLT